MEARIISWCDVLTAPLSTSAERQATLHQVEHFLASICCNPSSAPPISALPLLDSGFALRQSFWHLQSLAGFNLAECLLNHLARLHLLLQQELALFQLSLGLRTAQALPCSEAEKQRIRGLVDEACTALTLLQGLSLSHPPTKRICERKSWIELLLAMALSDYSTELVPSMSSDRTNNDFTHASASPAASSSSISLPSVFALEMLMCILVDSDPAQDLFNEIGGLQQIVQLSHRCGEAVSLALSSKAPAPKTTAAGTSQAGQQRPSRLQLEALKQTDLHCLEFRYFLGQLQKGDDVTPHDLDFSGKPGSSDCSEGTMADGGMFAPSTRSICVKRHDDEVDSPGSPDSCSSTSTLRDTFFSIRDDASSLALGRRGGVLAASSDGSDTDATSGAESQGSTPRKHVAATQTAPVLLAPANKNESHDQPTPRAARRRASPPCAAALASPNRAEEGRRIRSGHSAVQVDGGERRRLRPARSMAEFRSEVMRGRDASSAGRADRLLAAGTERASTNSPADQRTRVEDVPSASSRATVASSERTERPIHRRLHLPKIQGTGVTRSVGAGPDIVARLEAREQAAAAARSSAGPRQPRNEKVASPRRRAATDATPVVLAPRQAPSPAILDDSPSKPRRSSQLKKPTLVVGAPTTPFDSPKGAPRYDQGRYVEAGRPNPGAQARGRRDWMMSERAREDYENQAPPTTGLQVEAWSAATLNRRIPPSPAVRRAQMARARSLSPQKPERVVQS